MLGVDERRGASVFLSLSNDVQRQGGLARRFGTEDLDHAPAGDAADAEGVVDGQGRGRDDGDAPRSSLAELHDRALAELPFDLRNRQFDDLVTVGLGFAGPVSGHGTSPEKALREPRLSKAQVRRKSMKSQRKTGVFSGG